MTQTDLDLANLLGRLRRLEDERAILQAIARYAHTLDYGPKADWLDCFTPDATFEIRWRWMGEPWSFTGHEALADFYERHTHAPQQLSKHFATNHKIAIDGDGATVESYFLRLDTDNERGPTRHVTTGRYIDQLRRDTDGVWRINHRVSEPEDL